MSLCNLEHHVNAAAQCAVRKQPRHGMVEGRLGRGAVGRGRLGQEENEMEEGEQWMDAEPRP